MAVAGVSHPQPQRSLRGCGGQHRSQWPAGRRRSSIGHRIPCRSALPPPLPCARRYPRSQPGARQLKARAEASPIPDAPPVTSTPVEGVDSNGCTFCMGVSLMSGLVPASRSHGRRLRTQTLCGCTVSTDAPAAIIRTDDQPAVTVRSACASQSPGSLRPQKNGRQPLREAARTEEEPCYETTTTGTANCKAEGTPCAGRPRNHM